MRTYLKTFARMFKRHVTRLVSIFLMVLISVGFSSGLGMATEKMRYALDGEYVARNVSDFIVRGEDDLSDRAEGLRALGYEVVEGGVMEFCGGSMEAEGMPFTFEGVGDGVTRVYFYHEGERDAQNTPLIIDEAPMPEDAPQDAIPVAVERSTAQLKKYELGDTLKASVTVLGRTLSFSFVITEIVQNPLHLAVRKDVSMTPIEGEEDEYELLESIFYLNTATFSLLGFNRTFPVNSLYISVPALKEREAADLTHTLFDSRYERALKAEKEKVEAAVAGTEGEAAVLTLHENFTFESYFSYAEKVDEIGYVLMVVFLAVTMLVVLSTMTRLLEEERGQIACLATLGYPPMRTLSKYLLFALIGTLIGAVGGYFAGLGLAYIIYDNFHWNYALPAFPSHASIAFFFIVSAIILATTLAATLIAGLKMTRQQPATLLRPKAPRAGRKVILERIPLLWNRISFKYKSSLRNVLRYKTRFFMTVVSVMASTALVFAGLAVLDCCIFQEIGTFAMIVVSIVILAFAALLNAVVIYTLTNINISERRRELATLMVLGYQDKEVSLYVYREIYITSAIGIVLGVPFGALLCLFVFELIGFGSIAGIGWYVWIVAPLMALFFTFLVTLMLHPKIVKIDMNDSLKAIE